MQLQEGLSDPNAHLTTPDPSASPSLPASVARVCLLVAITNYTSQPRVISEEEFSSVFPNTNEENGFHYKKLPNPIFWRSFLSLQTLLYLSFTNSSSSDEDNDVSVCKVFLALSLNIIKIQRDGGQAAQVLGFNELCESTILPRLVGEETSMVVKGKRVGLQKAEHQRH